MGVRLDTAPRRALDDLSRIHKLLPDLCVRQERDGEEAASAVHSVCQRWRVAVLPLPKRSRVPPGCAYDTYVLHCIHEYLQDGEFLASQSG